jgi:nitronate monooxygenase
MALPSDIRARLTLPAVVAPMFLCSGPALAIAACKAGLVGSLTRNHCRDIEELRVQLASVSEELGRVRERHPDRTIGPLAVNISTHFAPEEMRAHMALCKSSGASIVITSVGDPTAMAPLVREAGLHHFHDATSIRFAEKAIAAGVDGIVAIGAGGGGHSGAVSHLALIPQIRAMFDGTVVLAGAVSTGAAIRAAEILGADLAYMGSRFIATRESSAPDTYKAMLVEGTSADVIYTPGINGVPASWLKASIRSVGLDPEKLPPRKERGTGHLPPGIKPWRDIWSAGQGLGLIHDIPTVAELVRRLQAEYVEACAVPSMVEAAVAAMCREEHE